MSRIPQPAAEAWHDELLPLLEPYFGHQGWPSVEEANTATQVALSYLRDLGVTF